MIKSKWVALLTAVLMLVTTVGTALLLLHPQWTASVSTAHAMAYETRLFSDTTLMEVNVVVDEAQWQSLLDNATAEEYMAVDVQINGETYKNVGIRAKGNTSLSGVRNDRYSFKIKFDKYVDGQTCYGLDKLALNNSYSDPTYIKEYLSYEMMSFLDVPSSLCSYARFSVNGEYRGLYLAVECLDESYMERNFGSDYGSLYKPDTMDMGDGKGNPSGGEMPFDRGEKRPDGEGSHEGEAGGAGEPTDPPAPGEEAAEVEAGGRGDWGVSGEEAAGENGEDLHEQPAGGENPGGGGEEASRGGAKADKGGFPGGFGGSGATALTDQGDDPDSYADIFDSAVFDITGSDKTRLIQAIQNLNAGVELEKSVDVDEVLRYFAVNTFLVNLDSYASNMKHNYYLYEKDGQLSILPWDYNLAFGAFQASSAENAVNFPIDTPVSGATLQNSPLIGKLLEVDAYRERYHTYLQQLVDDYCNSGRLAYTIDQVNALITESVASDPTAFYTYGEYTAAVAELRKFCALRAQSVSGQLDGSVPATEEAQRQSPQQLIDGSSVDMDVLGRQGGGGEHGGDRDSFEGGQRPGGDSSFEGAPDAPGGDAHASSEEGEPSQSPFDGMPDMKRMREAFAIVGDSDPDSLTPEQEEQLQALELSHEERQALSTFREQLPQQGFDRPGGAETSPDSTSLVLLGAAVLCLLAGVAAAKHFPRRR